MIASEDIPDNPGAEAAQRMFLELAGVGAALDSFSANTFGDCCTSKPGTDHCRSVSLPRYLVISLSHCLTVSLLSHCLTGSLLSHCLPRHQTNICLTIHKPRACTTTVESLS